MSLSLGKNLQHARSLSGRRLAYESRRCPALPDHALLDLVNTTHQSLLAVSRDPLSKRSPTHHCPPGARGPWGAEFGNDQFGGLVYWQVVVLVH